MSDAPSPQAPPPSPRSSLPGRIVIIAIFAAGIGAGLGASIYWSQPEHAVAGSFTQIHTSLMRGPKKDALRLLAPSVTLEGRTIPAAEFVETYRIPSDGAPIQVTPCPSTTGHWILVMKDRRYCFYREAKTWKLHWLEDGACRCK